jgi:hypothetical protein
MATETERDFAQEAFDNAISRKPWLLEHRSDPWYGNQITVTDSNHCALCRVPPSGPEQFKLARLIAESPKLLSIARRWVALDAGAWHPERYAAEKKELIADTEAVIAKAEGQ